ncbi:MAG: PilZ domain-containing protein [Deltaproteobacteria bacterium]|nr:PilZ domain-containing protein [Deltaproteobacteria bacterium]MBW1958605.1 PilZ domain-containing protein [Deltaproteobacteria bacterium]MBW2014789.1 PilZ domain-containing protein [Deltaproteobacteria bacterium]MBW2089838.1 PilZ domain-containing protein [Deltaproteobacteria bacterium]MBW2321127.1 PilZ domain-containing protein [Deltaproteobacteria bacterium]
MKKVFVDDTNQATIICPKCGYEKIFDVTNFKKTQKKLKAKCRCGEVFRVTLEFRKHYRKKVRLHGEYFVQGRDEKGEITVEDISASGIRFASVEPHYISRSDTVELKFTLDNSMKTEIHKLIKIVWIIDRNVGAQYIDPTPLEKELEVYLET